MSARRFRPSSNLDFSDRSGGRFMRSRWKFLPVILVLLALVTVGVRGCGGDDEEAMETITPGESDTAAKPTLRYERLIPPKQ
ncbi:MAG: hypothetical protein HQL52_00700 [Magnetococcales bacterium]|nr:hypothetical protein [Magnetococcales bacterium]